METNVIPMPIKKEAVQNFVETAIIKGSSKKSVVIETGDGALTAEVAFSCLVKPLAGDKVLISRTEKECYVLAVLEREEKDDMTLDFPGNVDLKAASGDIAMTSGRDINLVSAKKTHMASGEVGITAVDASVNAANIKVYSHDAECHAGRAKVFAKSIDTMADRIMQTAKTVVRQVEGVETVNIGSLIKTVKKIMSLRSHHAVITAKKDVMIDGERIQMG